MATTKDEESQRKGRGGRTRPGYCHRLYSETRSMKQHTQAAVEVSDLQGLALEMLARDYQYDKLPTRAGKYIIKYIV